MAKTQEAKTKNGNGKTDEAVPVRKFDEKTYEKADGSFKVIPLEKLGDNPNREPSVFLWNDDKIEGLIESYLAVGFQSTFEAAVDKWGNYTLGAGGHHRKEALRRAIERGLGDRIRGLFKNDNDEWCIKVVTKKYTKEEMLRGFMLENADAWGKDSEQNQCMMAIQVKSYLDQKLSDSKNLEEFIQNVNSPYPLQMNDRAFSRAKNSGAGGSLMVQYLGTHTWSRQAVDMLLSVLYEKGEVSEQYRELAERLPNVTLAYKFKQLMTEEEDGEKVRAAKADQEKALKLVETHQLSRKDIEEANKVKQAEGLSPLEALTKTIEDKKESLKSEKEKGKKKETPSKAEMKTPEAAMEGLKRAVTQTNMMVRGDESWSKAQKTEAKALFKDLAENMKKLV